MLGVQILPGVQNKEYDIMSKELTLNQVNKYKIDFNSCKSYESSMNTLTRSKLEDVTMDWETFRQIDHTYSNVISSEMKEKYFSKKHRFVRRFFFETRLFGGHPGGTLGVLYTPPRDRKSILFDYFFGFLF